MSDENFLARWSRRKHASSAGKVPDEAPAEEAAPAAVTPAKAGAQPSLETEPAPLPPVDSLTADSDFAPFMAKDVDPALKSAALRKLFQDERFNVMDGLDVYIDDYTKTKPIPAEWYAKMQQLAHLGDFNKEPTELRDETAAASTEPEHARAEERVVEQPAPEGETTAETPVVPGPDRATGPAIANRIEDPDGQ
jgi:hypothetical protein